MSDDSFLEYVLEQLADAKPLKVKAMFGGHGRAARLRAPVQGPKRSFGRACRMRALDRERSGMRNAAGTGGPARGAGAKRGSWRPASQRARHV